MDYRTLLDFCNTESQRRYIQAIIDTGSVRSAAKHLDLSRSSVRYVVGVVKKRAALRGYDPDHDQTHPVPETQRIKGVSTCYGPDGEITQQWVKTREDEQRRLDAIMESLEGLVESLPKLQKSPNIKNKRSQLMNVIPWGDPHFGMYAWAEECGDNFDIDIAKRDLCAAAENLIDRAPNADRCVFINLGDFFHADNMVGMTANHGHILDMDTRLPLIYRMGVAAQVQCINAALRKFHRVEIINVPGNHDEVLAFTLSILMGHLYDKEPRVTVHEAPTQRHYIEHGKVLIGAVHGHKTKDKDLPGIMATEKPEQWGRTKYRYWYRGHHHHDTRQEYHGCVVEQVRTLAARDSHTTNLGYLSGRDMKCITHHAEHGEVGRLICNIDMLK